MNRKETTRFLSDLLIREKLSGVGKYYSSEVVLDWGSSHPKRIDFLQYVPQGQMCVADIERGDFIVYEVKSCKEDVFSGNGLNFVGDENYIVTTMECYKSLKDDLGKLQKHVHDLNGHYYFSFLIAVPDNPCGRFDPQKALMEENENPTPLESEGVYWRLAKLKVGFSKRAYRNRPTAELLFYMLRSGR